MILNAFPDFASGPFFPHERTFSPRVPLEPGRTRLAPLLPVEPSTDLVEQAMERALAEGRSLSLYYLGGTSPGLLRWFRPIHLYRMRAGGPAFASGRCMRRGATRTLRLDRVRLA